MTGFHGLQVAVAVVAAVIAGLRVFDLAYRANLDADLFLTRLGELIRSDTPRARALCQRAGSAWIARMAAAELADRDSAGPASRVTELMSDLRREAVRGVFALITIGRAASPLAFVGVMVELGMAFQGDHGLASLQRGLVEQVAMQNAVIGVTLGLTTSTFSFIAAGSLRSEARRRLREVALVGDLFERAGARDEFRGANVT